ncbi:MAG: shikimate kinase [Bacteroidales bacterium]
MIISLCGFMGSGKSTIGKNLALYTGYRFIDLDIYLQNKLGISVQDIFTKVGEQGFRKEELTALKEIIKEEENSSNNSHYGLILALGGGTVTIPECLKIITEKTHCIYLNCPKEILTKRLIKSSSKRPLIAGKTQQEIENTINTLITEREYIYRECAKNTISVGTKSLVKIVEEIGLILKELLQI